MAGAALPAHADGHPAAHGRPAHVGRPRRPRLRRVAPLQAAALGQAILGRYSVLLSGDSVPLRHAISQYSTGPGGASTRIAGFGLL